MSFLMPSVEPESSPPPPQKKWLAFQPSTPTQDAVDRLLHLLKMCLQAHQPSLVDRGPQERQKESYPKQRFLKGKAVSLREV